MAKGGGTSQKLLSYFTFVNFFIYVVCCNLAFCMYKYLYVAGKMKDYVKCLNCGYESARSDFYLDIPLTIRPFGSEQAYGSVVSTCTSLLMCIYVCIIRILAVIQSQLITC